jgi:AcrR family transcriptional regulator
MRTSLVRADRKLFVRVGHAATGTPDIVAAAGVTHRAHSHHFTDKAVLWTQAPDRPVRGAVRA